MNAVCRGGLAFEEMGTVATNPRRPRVACSSFLEWLLNFSMTTALVQVFLGWTRGRSFV